MQALELTTAALDAAEQALGPGPVVMVNLLRFRDTPDYPEGFAEARGDVRSGYYEGYVGGFQATCQALGITPELIYAGTQVSGILVGPDDHWDEIVLVRYQRFADLRQILDHELYIQTAKPHRFAVIADWRFIATRARA
jgi:hypothetical protein